MQEIGIKVYSKKSVTVSNELSNPNTTLIETPMKTLKLMGAAAILVILTATTAPRADESTPRDPDQKRTNSLGMQFVRIPAGEFLMGTTDEDSKRFIEEDQLHWAQCENEKPAHKVRLTRDYFLGKHPVTVGQFRTFVEATGYETNAEAGYNPLRVTVIEGVTVGTWRDPDFPQGPDHPVVCVTTVDA